MDDRRLRRSGREARMPRRAVILAGGLGLRLRPYTMVLPKPLIPVGDHPILERIIHQLAAAGVRQLDICLGRHLGNLIYIYLSQASTLPDGLELRFHWEDEPQGTAGALRTIEDLEGSFLVMNGDILTTLDFSAFMRAHRDSSAALTIAMHTQQVQVSLGVIEWDDRRVTGYREKPAWSYDVSMGIYAFDASVLEYLPDDGAFQFPELVHRLLENGEHIAPYLSDSVWYDIGTPAEYERATADVQARPDLYVVHLEADRADGNATDGAGHYGGIVGRHPEHDDDADAVGGGRAIR